MANSSTYYKDNKKTNSKLSLIEQIISNFSKLNIKNLGADAFGGGYKLQFIKQITLPLSMEKTLLKQTNFSFGDIKEQINSFSNDKKTTLLTFSDLIPIETLRANVREFSFNNSFVNYADNNELVSTVGTSYLNADIIHIPIIYSIKKINPFSKKYIIENKITPHLLTQNHYNMNLKTINNFITLDQSDIF